ncbi:glycosyltransferase family 4 protein [Leptothermofonsia sichuanensis E412]|uniref:glycosyltransferase family 4 protein n=1 Tax=Leptothermofonsia sichuanensis TaxID=2917832 RepID=UPI001CA641D7|nr:glycosyltransferase family 4 protein [Leptothermofonsia sichuanensis]QZZ20412.1 glycosyltransferase family 4 protein [Leptothermofonsia sichuanensis E412]
MRIAFVTPEYVTEPSYSGGLANYLGRITVALVEQGHEIHVFTRSQQNETIEFQGVTVHRVVPLWDRRMILDHIDPLIPKIFYNPYQDFKAAWCLWRSWAHIHQSTPFDIVQVSNVMAVGLFFRWVRHTPVITRMSSYRPFWDTAAGITLTEGVKLRWWMERVAVTGTRHIYAPTYFVAGQVQKGYSIPQVDVLETPFFVEQPTYDTNLFEQVAAGKPYLLYFGRMTQMKGVHILTEALPELLNRFPEMHAFFIGGSGPAPDGKPMADYIRDRLQPFQERVHVLDSMRHDKLYPFILHARTIVLPSLMDNLPNTCLEAMGLGKLVVATTGTCFEQVIENGVSGILVTPGDARALMEGISQAWEMEETARNQMQEQAIQSINRLHPVQAIPRLIEYYESILAKQK